MSSTEEASDESRFTPIQKVSSVTNLALEKAGLEGAEGPEWRSSWEGIGAKLSFVMCTGNIWYFPVVCATYGGYFPVQYTICFVVIAMPLLYMEMALGQFASASPLSVFSRMAPALSGISAAMTFLLIFRCICLSVWTVYELAIAWMAFEGSWSELDWQHCPLDDLQCYDFTLFNACLEAAPNTSARCDQVQQAFVNTRGTYIKRPPFMNHIMNKMIKQSFVVDDWGPPPALSVVCALFVWLLVVIIGMGGSRYLGKMGCFVCVTLVSSYAMLFILSIFLESEADGLYAFFEFQHVPQDGWEWVWSWADAASHALRSLNVACGGIQKLASLNNYNHRFHHDVLIISAFSYTLHMLITVSAFAFLAELGSLSFEFGLKYRMTTFLEAFYPAVDPIYRINLLSMPLTVQASFAEIFTTWKWGWLIIFFYFFSGFLSGVQGAATYIWVICSMIVERVNCSNRTYGRPLTTWKRRLLFVVLLSLGGLFSSVLFLTPGGLFLMVSMEQFASYGAILVAFLEIVTVAHIYGFKRFSVNIRAMLGGSGPLNIFWWLNWVVFSPLALLVLFICVLSSYGHNRPILLGNSMAIEILGWTLLCMAASWVVVFFVVRDIERRRQNEPFAVLFRTTGDWGPANAKRRLETTRMERALRVRY